jgi:hypothetical protein
MKWSFGKVSPSRFMIEYTIPWMKEYGSMENFPIGSLNKKVWDFLFK